MVSQEQIQKLAQTVRDEGDKHYSVESSDGSGWRYLVTPRTKTAPSTCTCDDYKFHRAKDPNHRCKHKQAVRLYLESLRALTPKPPSIKKHNAAMEKFLREQAAKRPAPPRSMEDELRDLAKKLERGDADEFTKARYEKLYARFSARGDPPLAFWPAF